MCCQVAGVACVGVRGRPATWCAAAALALPVALGMRSAGRGGSEEEVEDVDEVEDEEEVVVYGDVGCATMRAGAALWAAAASAAATAGRMEGISSGCGLGAGGLRGPAVTWRSGGPIRSAAAGGGGAVLRSLPSGFGWAGLLQCLMACSSASAGGEQFACAAFGGLGGLGLGFRGCVWGACVVHWAGRVCRPALGSLRWVGVRCCVFEAVAGARRGGLWRACAGVRADGGGPCRGAQGCAQ